MVWLDDPLGWGAVVAVSALLGAMAVDRDLYRDELIKPYWAPPPWAFQIVWSILYAGQAVASYLLVHHAERWVPGIWVYLVYLVVSTAWNWVFFRWRKYELARLVIIVAAGLSLAATALYWEEGPFYCGLLMLFTAIWMVFATALNWSVRERRRKTPYTPELLGDRALNAVIAEEEKTKNAYTTVPVRDAFDSPAFTLDMDHDIEYSEH